LIEQLGGYEEAKMLRGTTSNALLDMKTWTVHVDDIDLALLEHRRANNIFERHDLVVFKELPFERLFSVRYVGGDSIVIHEIWDEAGARSFSEDKPYCDIRHATDLEIQAGRRL